MSLKMQSFKHFQSLLVSALIAAPLAAASSQSLRGSNASVDLMYTTAHSHDLAFLQTPDDVYCAVVSGALVMLSITEDITLDKASYGHRGRFSQADRKMPVLVACEPACARGQARDRSDRREAPGTLPRCRIDPASRAAHPPAGFIDTACRWQIRLVGWRGGIEGGA